MGGLYWGFPAPLGKDPYDSQGDNVYARRSREIDKTVRLAFLVCLSFDRRRDDAGDEKSTDMLVNQDDTDILPYKGEIIERLFNGGVISLLIHDEEVAR